MNDKTYVKTSDQRADVSVPAESKDRMAAFEQTVRECGSLWVWEYGSLGVIQ